MCMRLTVPYPLAMTDDGFKRLLDRVDGLYGEVVALMKAPSVAATRAKKMNSS